MDVQITQEVLILTTAIWLVVGVLKKIHPLSGLDSDVLALAISAGFGLGAYLLGYLSGHPVEVACQVVIAMFGANLIHDKLAKPLVDSFSSDEEGDTCPGCGRPF